MWAPRDERACASVCTRVGWVTNVQDWCKEGLFPRLAHALIHFMSVMRVTTTVLAVTVRCGKGTVFGRRREKQKYRSGRGGRSSEEETLLATCDRVCSTTQIQVSATRTGEGETLFSTPHPLVGRLDCEC